MQRKYALCLLIALALAALAAPIVAHADGPPQPIPADGNCPVPVDPSWTKQEQFVWLNVCIGKEADFNKEPGYGDNLDPKSAAGLPESRILRSSFLETILLKDEYRSALTRLGVRITGARFTETVDLENAELEHDLWLDRSLLEKGANLFGTKTSRRITFDGSKTLFAFNAAGAQIDKDLSMRGAEFPDNINLSSAHIGGPLNLSGSTVTGMLDMNGIRVDLNLLTRDKAQFKDIDLRGAHIGGQLDLSGSTVAGFLTMYGIRVDQDLFMRDKAQFKDIRLVSAHIGGRLELIGSTVTGMLNMNGILVDQDLSMSGKAQFNEIDLRVAHIGGRVELSGSTVTGELNMYGVRVDQDLFMRDKAQFKDIRLLSAHIGGQLILDSSTVTGKLEGAYIEVEQTVFLGHGATFDEIHLASAKLGKDLSLSGGAFNKNVDLTGAQVTGVLRLAATRWLGSATLDLTNAAAGWIDLSDSWPDKIYVNGLTYHNLPNFSRAQAETWFGKQAYAPQPYEELAGVLQSNGFIEDATAIRYAGKERERQTASGLNWVWLFLLNYSIGFGYHLEYAFAWALGFVLLGWAVLYATGQRTKHGMTLGLTYSFDMLLPLVQLNKKHDDIDLDPWPQRYFYVHKIVGVLLASFIAAGITGLTK